MRDEKRIDPMLAAVGQRWRRDPDLRLGQLLYNTVAEARAPSQTPPCPEIFYIEDEALLTALLD